MRSMNSYKNVMKNEKYMDDVSETVIANLRKKLLKKQMGIWGLDDAFLNLENSHDSVQTARDKILEKVLKNENVSMTIHKVPQGYEQERSRKIRVPVTNDDDGRGSPKSFCTREEQSELQNYQTSEEDGKRFSKTIAGDVLSTKSDDFCREESQVSSHKEEFDKWCQQKREELLSRNSLSVRAKNCTVLQEQQQSKKGNSQSTKKRNGPRPKSRSPKTLEKQVSVIPKRSQLYSKSTSQLDTRRNVMETQVRIKITDEKNVKNYEFIMDVADLARIKKNFPKLIEILPIVDAGNKTAQYCIEAVNIILRYVFYRRYNIDAMIATIGVEVLAAAKAWEINEIQQIFLKDFVQKVLPSSNINFVFYQARQYGLDAVCNACREIVADSSSLNSSSYKRKQKVCFITISTYIEPVEFSIPFYPIEQNLDLSFQRNIHNTVRFQALAGTFTITGIHIQLNSDYLQKCSNLITLEIDYSTKNISEDREVETGRCQKPQRPINVIYFDKHLVVNPNQVVEIAVETDTKPYLCSALPEETEFKKRVKAGEFILTVVNNFKNLCIVGKLLYHVQEQINDKMK